MSLSMPSDEFQNLQGCYDLAGLRAAVMGLCSTFGPVRNLTIFTVNPVGQPQALCFARMVKAEDEQRLAAALGIGRFAGQMVMVVNLRSAGNLQVS